MGGVPGSDERRLTEEPFGKALLSWEDELSDSLTGRYNQRLLKNVALEMTRTSVINGELSM